MEQRPNILLITTDQHSAEALGHLGCNDVKTPGMDRLAARGISFAKSYSANPVCCPARASWFTGRHTPENGVVANGANMVPSMPDLGQWLNKKWLQRLLQRKMAYSRQRCRTEFPPYLPAIREIRPRPETLLRPAVRSDFSRTTRKKNPSSCQSDS